jgi:hypothetical protein
MRFAEIKEIIDEWSPLGIPRAWCGIDEYDDYTQPVWEAFMANSHVAHIYQTVYNHLGFTFGKDNFECREIAEKIAALKTGEKKRRKKRK